MIAFSLSSGKSKVSVSKTSLTVDKSKHTERYSWESKSDGRVMAEAVILLLAA
jgi:hypothetical protein